MRWEITIWISAVLVVATSALHLTTEHDVLTDQTSSRLPSFETSTKQIHMVSGSEEQVVNIKTKNHETKEADNQSNLIEQDPNSSKSVEKISRSKKNDKNIGSIKLHSDLSSGEPGSKSSRAESETSEEDESDTGNDNGAGGGNGSGNEEDGDIDIPPETGDIGGGDEDDDDTDIPPGAGGIGDGDGEDDVTDPPPDTGGNGDGDGESDDADSQSTTEENDFVTGEDDGTTSQPETGGNDNENIVETTTGRVRGHVWEDNADIISYIDIKYGTFKTPFEAPVFPEKSKDDYVHYEKGHSKRCSQLQGDKYVGELDCLTLSIFKPSKAASASVLVHIHEGNFINESANPEIYGPKYLVKAGIILVLPNYRLGPFGFLCLHNETALGNAALKDLALALSWITKNIDKFGGDPKNIAVSGEGTAGALAGYLALSPMSKDKVSKVIIESGSVLSPWAIDRNPIAAATHITSTITGFESWQDVDTEALLIAGRNIVWRPCLESKTTGNEAFMVETPWKMLEKKEIKATFMIGSAKFAGVHESLNHTAASIQELNENVGLLLPNDLKFATNAERSRVGNRVKAQYFGEAAISFRDVTNRALYYTDVAYLAPGIRTARALVNSGATVYFYEFSFVGDLNRELVAVQNQVNGAVRGDIIGYLFFQEGEPADGTKEKDMIDQLIKLWTTFLKTGTPKDDGTPAANMIEWNKLEKATVSEEQWLSIDTETTMKKGLYVDRLNLWTNIYNDHFIDKSLAFGSSPSVYTVLVIQAVFFISFFRNAWHFF